MSRLINSTVSCSLFASIVFALPYAQANECNRSPIVSNDIAAFDGFGHAIAISHNKQHFIVGVPGDDNQYGINAGAAYIYRNFDTDWALAGKLMPSNLQFGDNFGAAVDIDDDYAVIGSPFADVHGLNSGRVTVYRRGNWGIWAVDQIINPSEGGQSYWFGKSVAVGGDFMVVGAPNHHANGDDSVGRVYLYKRTNNTWTLDGTRDFTQTAPFNAEFGAAVAVAKGLNNEDRFAVGSPGAIISGQTQRGRVMVQYRYAGGAWAAPQWLAASDTAWDSRYGESLAFGGGYLYVGAPGVTVNGVNNAGAVYVYRVVMQDGVPTYVQAGKITEWPTTNRKFGTKLSASGNDLIVTDANGWIYRIRVEQGATPTQIKTSMMGRWESPAGVSEKFGRGGAVWTGEELLVGDPGFDAPGMTDAGRVHRYTMGINPGSNLCEFAPVINMSNIHDVRVNCTIGATATSASTCNAVGGPDMFYRLEVPAGKYRFIFSSAHTGCDFSVHADACPSQPNVHNTVGCLHLVGGQTSKETTLQLSNQPYIIRLATYNNVNAGPLTLEIEPVTCAADLNGDNFVDVSDLLLLLGSWGACNGCPADLNGDNFVDVSDLLALFGSWGICQ